MTDDIDLSALADDDLAGQMHQDLDDGLKDDIEQAPHPAKSALTPIAVTRRCRSTPPAGS